MENVKKNLSYSGYSMYSACPKKYDLHYNHGLRPETQPIHLVFGSAVDKSLNEILMGNSHEKAIIAAKKELSRLFREPTDFSDGDFDVELLTEESTKILTARLRRFGWKGSNLGYLAESTFNRFAMGEPISPTLRRVLKFLVFHSLLEKIKLINEGFEEYVTPMIEEVVSVQTYVKRGILDFKAKLKGIDGVITCDNKTASKDYDPDAVKVSVQLAGYGAEKGAYIVFNKSVRKNRTKVCSVCGNNGTGKRHKTCDAEVKGVRCGGEWSETITPEIIPQIIVDDIPEHNRTMVEEAYQKTEELIATGCFPRNLTNCTKHFGRPCDFFNLCWNNNMKGLVNKNESK